MHPSGTNELEKLMHRFLLPSNSKNALLSSQVIGTMEHSNESESDLVMTLESSRINNACEERGKYLILKHH